MNEKKNIGNIENLKDRAVLEQNKQEDLSHWEKEKLKNQSKREKALKNNQDLLEQIREKQAKKPTDLNINKNFYSNVQKMQSQLENEIKEKEQVVGVKNSGKKLVQGINNSSRLQIVGGSDI